MKRATLVVWAARLALAALPLSIPAAAADIRPAIIYDNNPKLDHGFNEGVYRGGRRFADETGIGVAEAEIAGDADRVPALRKMAVEGRSPILVPGFLWRAAVDQVAGEFPDTRFVLIDAAVDRPNVASILFKEQEGSFLVGLIAAKVSHSARIGFVGGMDVPIVRRFGCGYMQGARYGNPDVEVVQAMTGTTIAAWNDPAKGGELARAQIARGADIVFAAAGATGYGVLQAAAEGGALGIGVDSNQNGLFPGKVLTSMLKRVDVATHQAFLDARDGRWEPGVRVLGLKEGGVGWALDENNRALISPDLEAAVAAAAAAIIDGGLVVHDYMTDMSCPD